MYFVYGKPGSPCITSVAQRLVTEAKSQCWKRKWKLGVIGIIWRLCSDNRVYIGVIFGTMENKMGTTIAEIYHSRNLLKIFELNYGKCCRTTKDVSTYKQHLHKGHESQTWGVPQTRGTVLEVPIIRTIVFWGLYWGFRIWGNYHLAAATSTAATAAAAAKAAAMTAAKIQHDQQSPNSANTNPKPTPQAPPPTTANIAHTKTGRKSDQGITSWNQNCSGTQVYK